MTAIATLSLADGQAAPVTHTFNPVNIDSAGVAKWADRIGGIALGFPVVSSSLKMPSKTSRNYRLSLKIVTPVLEVTSPSTASGIQPAPTKAYDLIGTMEFVLPERSTLAERKNLKAYMVNLLAHSVVTTAIENFETVY